jgi:colicin import membrane protein
MSPRTVAALLLAAALAPPARAADLNVITSVDVKDEGGRVVLSIRGSRKPSFTTFSMAEPPRFVIDFSESKVDGVPETVQVGDGTINVVKNLSYGSDATSIARVMIAFAADVRPPDVTDVGGTLVVRVEKPAGAAGAAVAKTAAPADDGKAAAAAVVAAAEEKARADREAQAKADADARAKTEAEEKARAEADARAAKAEADRVAEAAAGAAAAELRARDDRARAEQEAQAKAEAEQRRADEAAERADAERQGREREAERQKAREELARQKAEEVAAPKVAAEPEEAVPAPERRSEASRLEAGAPAAKLREVGFKQLAGASRVFVRTSVTPKFTIQDLGDGTIRLELENTRVERRNDLRFLDTSFFPSAVAMVSPVKHGTAYVVDIKLRQRVPYQQRIEGDVLAIDFERPAQAGAAPQVSAADAAAPTGDDPLPAAEEAPEAGATP